MNLPTREECFELLKKEQTPENIMNHSLMINKIAVFLAKKLNEKGINVNIELVDAASLLHDVKKWEEIKNNSKTHHGIEAYNLFKHKYPELANVIKKHMLYEIIDSGLDSWEEKLVHYADRRVNHDKLVSLKQRFDYLNKRYPPKDPSKRQKVYELNIKLEKEIFFELDIEPEDLKDLIE
ncbi:HDIG domain-containing protein [Candidatus Woesearchaeota archaeon]|nr:HDIG domain-containing protein [Candidatus Woesearchaeota archaeon]